MGCGRRVWSDIAITVSTHSLNHSFTQYSLTHSLTHSPTHSPTHPLTHSLTQPTNRAFLMYKHICVHNRTDNHHFLNSFPTPHAPINGHDLQHKRESLCNRNVTDMLVTGGAGYAATRTMSSHASFSCMYNAQTRTALHTHTHTHTHTRARTRTHTNEHQDQPETAYAQT